MDKTAPGKQQTSDVTRELLIALSFLFPDKDFSAEDSYRTLAIDKEAEDIVSNGAKEYRTELISLSFQKPPEVKSLPLA